MKKIWLFLCLLFWLWSFIFAIDVNISSSLNLGENEWVTNLGDVTIHFDSWEVTTFKLLIWTWSDDFFIFNNNLSDIKINNQYVSVSLDINYKTLTFNGFFSWTITVQWIKIRTYNQKINNSKIGLDYIWNSDIDVYTTNTVNLVEDGRYSDNMKPLSVSNLMYTTGSTSVKFFWNNSPDLDIMGYMIRMNKNGYFSKDVMDMSSWSTINDLDFTANKYSFEVYSKDQYYLSDPVIITIEKQVPTATGNQTTGTVDTGSTTTWTMTTTGTTTNTGTTTTAIGNITNSPFSQELNTAYQYAYSIGITTMPTIQQANINGSLIRAHMAKMMVNYAINVLDRVPDDSLICVFTDTDDQSTEIQWYIEKACQLGIMGVDTIEFNPNGTVTRAQFGTVLSRVLYGTGNEWWTPYYVNHLQALKDNGIITNTDPDLQEIRGYVMLMLQRSAQ